MRAGDVFMDGHTSYLRHGCEFGRYAGKMNTFRNKSRRKAAEAQSYGVRSATTEDFERIRLVETRAAARFSAVGLGFIAEAPPLPTERLAEFCTAGGLHVLEIDGSVVGVAAHAVLDGEGYLAELDVLPEHAGKRLGLRLLGAVEACLQAAGIKSVWLITYRDVPWNGPYYTRAGFTEQVPHLGSQVAQRLNDERAGRLGVRLRVAMRKELS